jgi:antitoxin YobK
MSMQDYEKAKELVKESHGISTFVGPRSEPLINLAENRLGLKFTRTYRRFLLEYGAGGIGSFEIYGIIDEDFENSGIPDVVWLTLRERKEVNFPAFLLPIYDLGDGELFCLDLRTQQDSEAKIVGFTPGYSSAQQKLDIVAEDFGKLFLDLILMELKIKRS